MISVEEAFGRLSSIAPTTSVERLPLSDVVGCVLAADLSASEDFPAFSVSAMDGFAVRSEDTRRAPARLGVTGTSRAGAPAGVRCESGTACRIFTGAVLPEGADAVVEQERVTADGRGLVSVPRVERGLNVRARGEVLREGEVFLRAGRRLSAPEVSVCAALGVERLSVRARPRVALIVSGDEFGAALRDSNGSSLAALLSSEGYPCSVAHVRDSLEDNADTVARAVSVADCVVQVGGMSVGDYDFGVRAMERAGAERLFWGVSQKPGKPIYAGVVGETPVVGLPGNPLPALLLCALYVLPVLRRLEAAREAPRLTAALAEAVAVRGEREEWVFGRVSGGAFTPARKRRSHDAGALVGSNAVALIGPPGAGAGDAVTLTPLPWGF